VDTVVTTNERVAGWKRFGASDEECEKLRWQAILYQRCAKDVDPSSVTELDLSNSDLRTVDLSQFPNVEILSLRNNRLSSWAGMGLSEMKKLKVLDLRDNDFRTAEEIGNLTTHLPALEVVGAAGNRFSGKHYREDVISSIPMLKEVTCPLHAIDESEITVDELVVAFKRMRKGQRRSKQDIEQFRFEAVIYRKKPDDTIASEITALDLSECGLSVVDFSEFVSLKKISLRANRMKAKNLTDSKLDRCTKITAFDIRDNLINDAATIGRIVDELPLLSMVFIEGNPGIVSLGDKDIRRRVRFLGKLAQIRKVDSKLQYLDGRSITAAEKCRALKGILQPQEIEELRFQFVVQDMGDDAYLEKVDLSQEGLHFVHGIKQLHQIKELDLSSNRLVTLRGQRLRDLPHLRVLSIKDNQFEDLDEILCELRFCDSLKTLYMAGAGKAFDVIEKYIEEVFLDLRGLDVIDDVRNPWPLTTQQTEAVRYLHTYYQIGGNNVTEIDLRDRDIPSAHFWSILLAFSDLSTSVKTKDSELDTMVGITTLSLSQGNFPHGVPSLYRFIVIYKLPSLMELDGVEISMDERANAEKQMKGIMVDSKKGDKLTLIGIRVAEQALMMKLASSGGESEETGVVSSEDIDYSYIAENGDSMESMKEIKTSLAAASVSIASTGSALSKSEIVINYLQIFALLLLFDVPWPDTWIEMVEWTVMFNLSVDTVWPELSLTQQYMKFALIVAAPLLFLWLYKIKLNRTNWHKEYITHWTRAKGKYLLFWLFGLIFSLLIGTLVNSKTLAIFSGKMPPGDSFSVMIWISVVITLWILLLFFNARNFRKHASDEEYWIRVYNRYRMRLALFFVTIFYMPVARTVLMTYRCDNEGNLELYSDQDCARINEPSQYPPMYYIAGVFALAYIICVPVFFAILIFRGSKEVERTYGLKQDDERLSGMKKEYKKDPTNVDAKFAFIDQKRAVENKYASGVQGWRSASSYLYSSYERGHKFMKILQMFVKFCLLCIAIFVGFGYIQPLCGFIVLALFFLYGILTRPFSDDLEDVMDLCSILANTITAFIAYLLKSGNFPSFLDATTALVVVNGANLVILFINILIHPIRVCIGQSRLRKEQEKVESGTGGGDDGGGGDGGGDGAGGVGGVPGGADVGGAAAVGGGAAGAVSGADDILADHDIEMVMDSGESAGESGAGVAQSVGGPEPDDVGSGIESGAGAGADVAGDGVDAGADVGGDALDAGGEVGGDAVDAGADMGGDAVGNMDEDALDLGLEDEL
jgi:Leucine-rich repeat (LRR) protein